MKRNVLLGVLAAGLIIGSVLSASKIPGSAHAAPVPEIPEKESGITFFVKGRKVNVRFSGGKLLVHIKNNEQRGMDQ